MEVVVSFTGLAHVQTATGSAQSQLLKVSKFLILLIAGIEPGSYARISLLGSCVTT